MNEKLILLISEAVNEINQNLDHLLPVELGAKCPLFGTEGTLDSIGLVLLIVNVEQRIEEAFGANVILASEKAMSQRNSPFLTIGSLANFSELLIMEVNRNE